MRALLLYLNFFMIFTMAADEIEAHYHLMEQEVFEHIVVGNTIVGVTRQSQSLYMLYFFPDHSCELWKQKKIYTGNWWIENDESGRDAVRAFWPEYISQEPHSLFSPENPRYGSATSACYYIDSHGSILIAGRTYQTAVLLVPGCAFPSEQKMLNKNFN